MLEDFEGLCGGVLSAELQDGVLVGQLEGRAHDEVYNPLEGCLADTLIHAERLGVGVTLVLTIEISRGSAQAVLPVCGELLWLEMIFLLQRLYNLSLP